MLFCDGLHPYKIEGFSGDICPKGWDETFDCKDYTQKFGENSTLESETKKLIKNLKAEIESNIGTIEMINLNFMGVGNDLGCYDGDVYVMDELEKKFKDYETKDYEMSIGYAHDYIDIKFTKRMKVKGVKRIECDKNLDGNFDCKLWDEDMWTSIKDKLEPIRTLKVSTIYAHNASRSDSASDKQQAFFDELVTCKYYQDSKELSCGKN